MDYTLHIGDSINLMDSSCQDTFVRGDVGYIIAFGKKRCNCRLHPNTFFDVKIKCDNKEGWVKSEDLWKLKNSTRWTGIGEVTDDYDED